MDRENRPTERLADASFLEELLRGRRTLVVSVGDPAPAQHLARRLGGDIQAAEPDAGGRLPAADHALRGLVVLGGFENTAAVDALITEARRVLAADGLFAVSWVDAVRPSLEAPPDAAATKALAPTEAERRLGARFANVTVVARKPYLGFQYVSGATADDALTFDTSLTGGVAEQPTGFLALASDSEIPLADALIQVPYDPVVQRVSRWVRAGAPASGMGSAPAKTTQTVVRRRDAGDDTERLRSEATALRERAQTAVEESDRARGEARAAREKAALLEAEVGKLRGRIKGGPDPDGDRLKAETAERTRERDQARNDAEGAAREAARALEAAARLERDVDFLNERVRTAEADNAKLREAREQAAAAVKAGGEETAALRAAAEQFRADASKANQRVASAEEKLAAAEAKITEADGSSAEREKRVQDVHRRAEQALKRQQDAEKRMSELESAKFAAERAAEDAWKRVKDLQAQVAAGPVPAATSPAPSSPAGDLVPQADLAAVQEALASAIARAEAAEREQQRLAEIADGEKVPVSAKREIEDLQRAIEGVHEELAAAKRRADDAELRALEAQHAAADAEVRLEQLRAAAGDDEGIRSLLHQRETALSEAQERSRNLEIKAGRFAADATDAMAKLRVAEETIATRDGELAKALSALKGVESREGRDRELVAELRGEVARLTEALDATRDDLRKASSAPIMGQTAEDLAKERDRAVDAAAKAQAESARVHSDADALRERLDQTSGEMTKLLTEIGRSQAAAAEKERRIAEIEGELIQVKAAKGKADTSDVERRSVQMAQRISLLEAELERAKDDVKQASAEARKYRALAEAIDPPADRAKG